MSKKGCLSKVEIFSPFLFFFVGFFFFYRMAILSGLDQIPGDLLDVQLIVFLQEHVFKSLLGEVNFLSPSMFYPVPNTLGYSDAMLAPGLIYGVFRILGFEVFSASLLGLMASSIATFLICFLFNRKIVGLSVVYASLGATLFTFSAARLNQMNHQQLQPIFLVLIMCWIISRTVSERRSITSFRVLKNCIVLALLFHLQLLTAFYTAWFFGVFLFLCCCVIIGHPILRREFVFFVSKFRKPLVFAALIFLVCALPFLYIYMPVADEFGLRSYRNVKEMLPYFRSYFWMGRENFAWSWLKDYLRIENKPLHWEHRIGLGIIWTVGFVMISAWAIRVLKNVNLENSQRKEVIFSICAVSCFIFWLLTLQVNGYSLWIVPYEVIPGAGAVRAVSRYILVVSFPLSCIFAYWLQKKSESFNACWKKILILAIGCCAIAEQLGSTGAFSSSQQMARINQMKAQIRDGCEAFYLLAPEKSSRWLPTYQTDALIVSALTGIPTLNGYSGLAPKKWNLGNPTSRDYLNKVQKWRALWKLEGKICEIYSED